MIMKQGRKPFDPEAVLKKLLYDKAYFCFEWARGAKKYAGGDDFAQKVGDLAESIWNSIFVVRPELRDKELFEEVLREKLKSLSLEGFQKDFRSCFLEELVEDIMKKGFDGIKDVLFFPSPR